jgi:hypothetical protein
MTQQPAFCRNCGQPLSPGTAFCINCGAAVSAQSSVPTNDAPQPAAYMPQPMPYPAQPAVYPALRPKKRPSVGVILVGLLLILVGLRGPAALLFGKSATARIDSVRQVVDSTADRMDYTYRISYSFAADGKSQGGSYDLNKVYNVATLPGTGSLLTVKYIPGLAFINTPASQGSPGLAMLLLCGLGILLIVLGAKGTVNLRFGKH